MRYLLLTLLVWLYSPNMIQGQDCDCAYPIIFVHGWNGDGGSWDAVYENADFISTFGELTDTYHAVLNVSGDADTDMWGLDNTPDDDPLTSIAEYKDDDVIVHEQFHNLAPLKNGCIYAINFNAFWNQNPNVPNIILDNITYPASTSPSNQSAIFKQGYALGRMIKNVVETTGKNKVILVAHSMGGLASREYLQRKEGDSHKWWAYPEETEGGHRVANLLTVGTPHRGSNTGNTAPQWPVDLANLLVGFDLQSEAVRDMRYSVLNSYPGVYLFGGEEEDIPLINPPEYYYNKDVNCNGVEEDNITGLNIAGPNLSPPKPSAWEGTYDNPIMSLPPDIKYTYYVADQYEIGNPIPIGQVQEDEASDIIVLANRQWLFKNDGPQGDGSTRQYLNRTSIPAPLIGSSIVGSVDTNYILSDRITTPNLIAHTESLGSGQTGDVDQVMRGVDEGDYPYFAALVESDRWYSGIANLRADIVPVNSEYTNSGNNKIDGDWFKVTLSEPISELKIEVDVANEGKFITQVDLFEGPPSGMFDNQELGDLSILQGENEHDEISDSLRICDLVPESTYYFRISNDLQGFSSPETAWRFPYKFRIVTTPALFLNGVCPSAPDCSYTFVSYGSGQEACGSSDIDCNSLYDGEYGNIRIPIHIMYAGGLVTSTDVVVNVLLESINSFLQASGNLPWEFYISSESRVNSIEFDNFGDKDWENDPVIREAFRADSLAHQDEIRLVIVDKLKSAEAGYPLARSTIPKIIGSNWVITRQEYINENNWGVIIHELGHIFGLFHTFECQAFPFYNLCNSGCREGDGIADTPFDEGPFTEGQTGPANVMDYDQMVFTDDPTIEITPCQVAKMEQVLFNCRNNFCLPLQKPDVRFFDNNLSVENISGLYNEPLAELVITLNGQFYSNDDSFAFWKFLKPDGSTFELWANYLDLNTLYSSGQIDQPGLYTVEVRDRRIFNEVCQSDPVVFTINLEPCNDNGICDSWETIANCSDCDYTDGNRPDIVLIEYFFDVDPGMGNGVTLPVFDSQNSEGDYLIDLSSISSGLHSFYVRAQSSTGAWSFVQQKLFYLIEQEIASNSNLDYLEYFIDIDPGKGNGIDLPLFGSQASEGDYLIDLSSISPGLHTFSVRARNEAGDWSFVQQKLFYSLEQEVASNPSLDYLEYFIDLDPGKGNGVDLPLFGSQTSEGDYLIDLSGISPGLHSFYVRARDSKGHWSFVQKRIFYCYDGPIGERQIVQLEYFIDQDPGKGNGTQISVTPASSLDVTNPISISGLSGNHRLFVRAKDNLGHWSFTVNDTLLWSDRSIDVLYPNGGQSFETGQTLANINWTTENITGTVNIDLITATGEFVTAIASNISSLAPFSSWEIPPFVQSGAYRILIYETTSPTVQDFSDTPFSITSICNYPIGLNTTSITETSASVNWETVAEAENYLLQWKTVDATIYNEVSTSELFFTLTNLLPNTTYVSRISADCFGANSVWSPEIEFTTNSSGYCNVDGDWTITENPLPSGIYRSSGVITYAGQIEVASNVVISAGQGIILKPGFSVTEGGQLLAKIEDCDPIPNINSTIPTFSNHKMEIFPNPFSDITKVRFYLKSKDEISMILSDFSGRPVSVLALHSIQEVGWHEIEISRNNLPSGLYIVSLIGQQQRIDRRLLLVSK